MPKRQANNYGFNLATVAQIFAIPALTGLSLWYAQWITYGDTLKRHDEELKVIVTSRENDKKEFAGKFDAMNQSLSTLNTQTAVQGETLKTISAQLGSYLQQQQHK